MVASVFFFHTPITPSYPPLRTGEPLTPTFSQLRGSRICLLGYVSPDFASLCPCGSLLQKVQNQPFNVHPHDQAAAANCFDPKSTLFKAIAGGGSKWCKIYSSAPYNACARGHIDAQTQVCAKLHFVGMFACIYVEK